MNKIALPRRYVSPILINYGDDFISALVFRHLLSTTPGEREKLMAKWVCEYVNNPERMSYFKLLPHMMRSRTLPSRVF